MKIVYMPEYQLELNLGGEIVQMKRDDEGRPYVEIPERLEHLLIDQVAVMAARQAELPAIEEQKPALTADQIQKEQELQGRADGSGAENPEEVQINTTTHKMTSPDVRDYVDTIADVELLKELRAGECAHAEFKEGRKTVLEAIDARLKKLETSGNG